MLQNCKTNISSCISYERSVFLLFPVIAHKINAALVTSFGRTQKASKPSRFTTKSPDQHHLRLNLSAPWNSRKVEEVYTVGKWRQWSTGTKHHQTVHGTLCSAKLWSGLIRPTHIHNERGSHWNNRKQNWMHLNANHMEEPNTKWKLKEGLDDYEESRQRKTKYLRFPS